MKRFDRLLPRAVSGVDEVWGCTPKLSRHKAYPVASLASLPEDSIRKGTGT